jgi:hypothetical protein
LIAETKETKEVRGGTRTPYSLQPDSTGIKLAALLVPLLTVPRRESKREGTPIGQCPTPILYLRCVAFEAECSLTLIRL